MTFDEPSVTAKDSLGRSGCTFPPSSPLVRPRFRQGIHEAWLASTREFVLNCRCRKGLKFCVCFLDCSTPRFKRMRYWEYGGVLHQDPYYVPCGRVRTCDPCRLNDAIRTGFKITQAQPNVWIVIGGYDEVTLLHAAEEKLLKKLKKLDAGLGWGAVAERGDLYGGLHSNLYLATSLSIREIEAVVATFGKNNHVGPHSVPSKVACMYSMKFMRREHFQRDEDAPVEPMTYDDRVAALKDHLALNKNVLIRQRGLWRNEEGNRSTSRQAAGRTKWSRYRRQRNLRDENARGTAAGPPQVELGDRMKPSA